MLVLQQYNHNTENMAYASSEDLKLWPVRANAGLWSYNKTRSTFLFLTEKLLKKIPQTTPLYQLFKRLQKLFKEWRNFKDWQRISQANMHEQENRSFQVPENSIRDDSLVPTKLPSCKVPNNAASTPVSSHLSDSILPAALLHFFSLRWK